MMLRKYNRSELLILNSLLFKLIILNSVWLKSIKLLGKNYDFFRLLITSVEQISNYNSFLKKNNMLTYILPQNHALHRNRWWGQLSSSR